MPASQWNCPACTFSNQPQHDNCQMCATKRPAAMSSAITVQIPQGVPVGGAFDIQLPSGGLHRVTCPPGYAPGMKLTVHVPPSSAPRQQQQQPQASAPAWQAPPPSYSAPAPSPGGQPPAPQGQYQPQVLAPAPQGQYQPQGSAPPPSGGQQYPGQPTAPPPSQYPGQAPVQPTAPPPSQYPGQAPGYPGGQASAPPPAYGQGPPGQAPQQPPMAQAQAPLGVKEGWMMKESGTWGSLQKRYLKLNNGYLRYYKDPAQAPQGSISLSTCRSVVLVASKSNPTGPKNCFCLPLKNGSRTYRFEVEKGQPASVASEWFNVLQPFFAANPMQQQAIGGATFVQPPLQYQAQPPTSGYPGQAVYQQQTVIRPVQQQRVYVQQQPTTTVIYGGGNRYSGGGYYSGSSYSNRNSGAGIGAAVGLGLVAGALLSGGGHHHHHSGGGHHHHKHGHHGGGHHHHHHH